MRTGVLPQSPFFTNVEPRFNSFKEKIQKIASKNHIIFDEDIFMDTLIRCMSTFMNETPNNNDVDKYFWVAYRQNMANALTRDKFKNKTDISAVTNTLIYEEYNENIDILADMCENAIREHFGDRVFEAWKLHVCDNLTYKEINKLGYEDLNLHNEFREIKRYMTGKFLKNNTQFTNLAKENNLF